MPKGFAHGFLTLAPETRVAYKVTARYDAASDRGLLWNDPSLGIDWGVSGDTPILSPKDQTAPRLADLEIPFQYSA